MKRFALFSIFSVALSLFCSSLALADKATTTYAGVLTVQDDAGAFSASGIEAAKAAFSSVEFLADTKFSVYTVKEIPAAKLADFEAAKAIANPQEKDRAGKEFFGNWAKELAKDNKHTGIVMLIYYTGESYFIHSVADRQTDVQRNFTDKDLAGIRGLLLEQFREAKSTGLALAEAQKLHDSGLLKAVEYVADQLKNTTVSAAATQKVNSDDGKIAGRSIGGWLCLGVSVLLGVWLVIGLFRALSGGGGGGGGFGGGGGGGGFFPSLMGGMFGAMAGMYLYNSFMGGGMSDASAADSYSGDGGAGDDGAGDFDGGASDGGGDWGDSGSGGDWGGGGDFGGGDW